MMCHYRKRMGDYPDWCELNEYACLLELGETCEDQEEEPADEGSIDRGSFAQYADEEG